LGGGERASAARERTPRSKIRGGPPFPFGGGKGLRAPLGDMLLSRAKRERSISQEKKEKGMKRERKVSSSPGVELKTNRALRRAVFTKKCFKWGGKRASRKGLALDQRLHATKNMAKDTGGPSRGGDFGVEIRVGRGARSSVKGRTSGIPKSRTTWTRKREGLEDLALELYNW